jgi:hypothetical protein
MHLHFCVVIGRVKFEDWHWYVYLPHVDGKTNGDKCRWMMWDRLFSLATWRYQWH